MAPTAPQRFGFQFTVDESTFEKFRNAQALLSHQIPSGDVARIFDHVLTTANAQYEKRKFAATAKPRAGHRSSRSARHIPAHVKRAVWERDSGRCTYVGESGRRCEERKFLEFDHVESVARGGEATVENLRVRCRAHNQYAAEQSFGAGFMQVKREQARGAAAEARARKAAAAEQKNARAAAASDPEKDVRPWLRALGARPDELRRAAELCESIPDAPLEERIRYALKSLAPASARRSVSFASTSG